MTAFAQALTLADFAGLLGAVFLGSWRVAALTGGLLAGLLVF